jgi:4-amino-4-deoxy-L-arabinose transferase-like glycosyltransferase
LNVDINLLDLLQANTQGVEYLMAVPSSMQGADYILATGRPVLYMGGFMGQDEVLTPESLAKLVADGKLPYIYWNTLGGSRPGGGAFGGQSLITSWVASNCQVVQAFNTATSNFGEPDVINRGIGGNTFPGRAQPVVLYDCAQ